MSVLAWRGTIHQARERSRAACLVVLLLVACPVVAHADTDCSVREPIRDDPTWSCTPASDYVGSCVPSSDFQAWGCLELDADATLCDDGGAFNLTVYLAHSGHSLDCDGALIDHGYQDGDPRYPAIRTPYSYSVSDINLRGCAIQNTGRYGVDLKRFFRGSQLSGPMMGHSDITVEDFSIVNPTQWGIYVGQNSRGIRVRNTIIDNAYGGIYLEAGSAGTRITDGMVVNSHSREGIAVDSSSDNVIEGSFFAGNGDAVNVYKNCGETDGQVCPITRSMDADRNFLRGNTFDGDDVHVAWRQFKLYGLGFCENIDVAGYWRDHAADNVFDDNDFEGADLDVDDGPIVVHGNRFAYGAMLELGIDRPPFYSGSAVQIPGAVAGNVFGNAAGIDYASSGVYGQLEVFSNRDFSGACESYNSCAFGPTTLLGRRVGSPGVWAILL